VLGERFASFSMPDSIHAVLAARIDRLPAMEKAALQAAAVVGRVFWTAPVVHLLDGAEPDFALLEERDLIRSRRASSLEGEREYAIKHALTREVAYGSIPRARRGRLHAELAEWLEQGGFGRDEHAALVAYHYSRAVDPEDADLVWADDPDELTRVRDRAVVWLRHAGELARSRHEISEAIELLERAVSLSQDEHERALLWREIGLAQALRFDGEAFWAAMERALDGPLDTHERADAYSLLAFQTSIRSGMWSVRPSRERIEEWVAAALEVSDEGSIEQVRALIARIQAEPSEATDELLDATVARAEETGDADLLSFAFAARSHAAFVRLKFDEAQEWSRRRLELVPRIEDPDSLCEVYESGVPAAASVGLIEDARGLCDADWPVARRLSAHHRVHAVSLRLELADTLGDWDGIVRDTDLTVGLVDDNLATPCVRNPRDLLLCAVAHLYAGDEKLSRDLESRANALGGDGHERDLAHPRVRLALARGDLDAVRDLLRLPPRRTFVWGGTIFGGVLDGLVALRDWERIERDAPPLLQPGTVPEPFALRALGIARRDDGLLAKADERFAAIGLHWYRAQSETMLAAR
jgi:tetratricopeptide (TPR) repeat protein